MTDLYFIALLPPRDIAEEVTRVKGEMAERYGASHALRSPPHITLQMPFRWTEGRLLAEELKEFAARQETFSVTLNGYGCFPPKVIYVDVEENPLLIRMQKALQDFLEAKLNFRENQLTIRFHPHITIAHRDLKKSVFQAAWAEFSTREFRWIFTADNIALLRHNGHSWEVLEVMKPGM